MKITPELIQYLESLARIELTPAEEATVGDQLQELLTYIDTLSQLDTDGVEAKSHCFPVTNVFRKDQVEVHMTPEEVAAAHAAMKKFDAGKEGDND